LIQAWRLSKARYAGDLSGIGAAQAGQRWNQRGQRAVYLGRTPEITVLETLVHLNGVLSAPLVLCCYELPDEMDLLVRVQSADLPSGWDAIPHGHASAAFGGAWLGSVASLALELPSVVVPQARNLQVNPLHPAITQVTLLDQTPFRLDQRLT
jgi:RES domain-containing protein